MTYYPALRTHNERSFFAVCTAHVLRFSDRGACSRPPTWLLAVRASLSVLGHDASILLIDEPTVRVRCPWDPVKTQMREYSKCQHGRKIDMFQTLAADPERNHRRLQALCRPPHLSSYLRLCFTVTGGMLSAPVVSTVLTKGGRFAGG